MSFARRNFMALLALAIAVVSTVVLLLDTAQVRDADRCAICHVRPCATSTTCKQSSHAARAFVSCWSQLSGSSLPNGSSLIFEDRQRLQGPKLKVIPSSGTIG